MIHEVELQDMGKNERAYICSMYPMCVKLASIEYMLCCDAKHFT